MNKYYVFDSNAIIKINKLDIEANKVVLEEMKSMKCYIPEIVYEEVKINKEKDYKQLEKRNDSLLNSEITKLIEQFRNAKNQMKSCGIKFDELDTKLAQLEQIKVNGIFTEYNEYVESYNTRKKDYLENIDYPCETIPYSISKRVATLQQAKLRAELKIPPGYGDLKKKSGSYTKEFNDYYIWMSILEFFGPIIAKDDIIILVTDDKKENETDKSDLKFLKDEMLSSIGCNFERITSDSFLDILGYNSKAIVEYKELIKTNIYENYTENSYSTIASEHISYSGTLEEEIDEFDITNIQYESRFLTKEKIEFDVKFNVEIQFNCESSYGEVGHGEAIVGINKSYILDTVSKELVDVSTHEFMEDFTYFDIMDFHVSLEERLIQEYEEERMERLISEYEEQRILEEEQKRLNQEEWIELQINKAEAGE